MKRLDEFVAIYDDILSPDLAARLLAEYADSSEWQTPNPDASHKRESHSAILITHDKVTDRGPGRAELADAVVQALATTFDKYHQKFSRRDQGLNFLHVDKLVGVRINRYQVGQYMVTHTDKYPDAETGIVSWPAVTFSLNLNDDFSGGELSLLDGEIEFKGKARQGIFYPANFLYPHAVNPVTQGTRYALVGWFL